MSKPISNQDIRQVTLDSYSQHIEEYVTKKDALDIERTNAYWHGVAFFLSQLKPGETIFEIGSGTGYDAIRMESEGFKVKRSDAIEVFTKKHTKDGYGTKLYNVLDSPLSKKERAIYANAVLLHFNLELFRLALGNIRKSLLPDGVLCIGMKLGDFEGWREKGLSGVRYFKFWKLKDLKRELEHADFKVLNSSLSKDKSFVIITSKLVS